MWEWRQGKRVVREGGRCLDWLFQWGICGRKGRGTQNIPVSTFPSSSTIPSSIFCLDGLSFKAMLFLCTLKTEPHSPCVHPARKWFVIVFWTFKSPSAPFLEKAMAPCSSILAWKNPMDGGAWSAAVHGVAKSRTRLTDFTFSFHFHALEKEMATHSSVLAWRIPGMG